MSGSFLPPVIAILGASIGEFSAKMGEARAEMRDTEGSFAEAGALGKGALLGIGAVAVGVGYESVKMASGFDQAMEMIHTQAGASQQEVDNLKGSVLALAPAVGMGPETLAEGLYHVESAGFRGAQAMGILTAAAKLATIGQSDFETTAQAVVGVMSSQIKGVKDAADAGNLLNTTVGMGDMKMQQLALAIGTGILPKAAAAGLSFEDVGSALATLTDNVTPANEAATRLGMTFSMMSAPTQKAQDAYNAIGMSSRQMAQDMRGPGGLTAALEDLQNHLNKTYPPSKALKLSLVEQRAELKNYSASLASMGVPLGQQTTLLDTFKTNLQKSGSAAVEQSAALSAMFGGGKSSGTMMTLLGEMDRFRSKTEQYGTAASRAKAAQEAWASQQKQFSQQIKEIGARFEVWGVQLGNILIPYLQKFIGWVETGAKWVEHHKAVLAILAGVIAGLVVPAIYAMGKAFLESAADMLTNPVFLVIAAIAAAAYLIITHWSAVKRFFTDLWKWMEQAAGDVAHFFERVWADVAGFFEHAWGDVAGFAKRIWGDLAGWFAATWNDVAGFFTRIWQDVSGFLARIWGDVAGFFKRIWSDVAGWFAGLWAKAMKPLTEEWRRIRGDLASIWQSLVKIWDGTGGRLVTLIADGLRVISRLFSAAWRDVTGVVSRAWKTISGAVAVAMQMIAGWIEDGWDFVVGLFSAAWRIVAAVVSGAWDVIVAVVDAALNVVAGIVKAGWDVVTGIVRMAWDLIVGVVRTAWALISGLVRAQLSVVMGVLRAGWAIVVGGVKVAWALVTGVINTALDVIKGVLKIFADLVTGQWGKLWGDVKGLFSSVWSDISGMFSKILGTIKSTVLGAVKDIWGGFTGAIKDAVGAASAALNDVETTVVGFFKDAVTWLEQAGKDVIQGLINGVKHMAGSVVSTVKNTIGSVVSSVTSFLGIGSPSRVFHEIGLHIGEGLVNGISSMHGAAASASKGLAGAVAGGFGNGPLGLNLNGSGVGGGISSGSGVIVVVNVQGSVHSASDLSKTVRQEVLRYQQRNSGNRLALSGVGR